MLLVMTTVINFSGKGFMDRVETNASDKQPGVVLIQGQPGGSMNPIGYFRLQ